MGNFIFDSNVYDLILDKNIDVNLIKSKGNLYITNVQLDEIKNTADEERRFKLIDVIVRLNHVEIDLESGVWLNDLFWDNNQIYIDSISESCSMLLGNTTNNKRWKDVLIGEVAKRHSLILVTKDIRFKKKAELANIETVLFESFLAL